jgi:hypothetical protein
VQETTQGEGGAKPATAAAAAGEGEGEGEGVGGKDSVVKTEEFETVKKGLEELETRFDKNLRSTNKRLKYLEDIVDEDETDSDAEGSDEEESEEEEEATKEEEKEEETKKAPPKSWNGWMEGSCCAGVDMCVVVLSLCVSLSHAFLSFSL